MDYKMTKQQIRDAIKVDLKDEIPDYEYLIANEPDIYIKQQIIDLYFDSLRIDQNIKDLTPKQVDLYWRKELKRG